MSDSTFAAVAFPSVDGGGVTAAHDVLDVERAVEQGRVRGHAAGYAAGLRAATLIADERLAVLDVEHAARSAQIEARLDAAHAALQLAVRAVQQTTTPILEQSDTALVAAATELAEAIIGRELSARIDGATAAVQRVISALSADDDLAAITVRLHPSDVAVLIESQQLPVELVVKADAQLQPGDAIAELPNGLIDARIGTALLRARRALLEGAA